MRFVILCLAIALATPAFAGNEGGHGGDPYALEFVTIGSTLAQAMPSLQAVHPELFSKWNFSPRQFAQVVSSVRVISDEGESVVLQGAEVDAINTPASNQILLNRTRWREDDLHARVQLVLHEYFGILNVERDRYTASMDFAEFALSESKQIEEQSVEGQFMANLFYGRCISVPSLVSTSTCDLDPAKVVEIQNCAKSQAEGMCRLSGKAQCELVSLTQSEKLSSAVIGLRYCEVLAIMK